MLSMICNLYTLGAPHVINPRPLTRINLVLSVMQVMRVIHLIRVRSPTSFVHIVSVLCVIRVIHVIHVMRIPSFLILPNLYSYNYECCTWYAC